MKWRAAKQAGPAPAADSPVVELRHVVKHYGACNIAVRDVSLRLGAGQLLALLGPSGCGKTTTLRLIAGLEAPDQGEIWLHGRCVAAPKRWVPPEERQLGIVFQDYALFPHLTVFDNIQFPLHTLPARERPQRVGELLDLMGLEPLARRYPHQLSGGQQQRVALARALAPRSGLILLDEPFSNLDAALRKSMRDEVRAILQRAGATAILVTHDQEEALSIADQIAVLHQGGLAQFGTPPQIYHTPASLQVAALVGEINTIAGEADGGSARCALGTLPLAAAASGPVAILLRPESLVVRGDPAGRATVERVVFLGHDQLVHLLLADGARVFARVRSQRDLAPGMAVAVAVEGPVMAYPA